MENLKCPICEKKIDAVLTPVTDNFDLLTLCENEYFRHGLSSIGLAVLVRKSRSMLNELALNRAHD